ncbi:MAG: hypothetical protein ACOCTQ_04435 [Planctomycetota bacterium]
MTGQAKNIVLILSDQLRADALGCLATISAGRRTWTIAVFSVRRIRFFGMLRRR